jgi:hypothetical protein
MNVYDMQEVERLKKEIEIREKHFDELCEKYENLKEALLLILKSV